jgi:LmbE family N-acetylglucosaminyl deacetylase
VISPGGQDDVRTHTDLGPSIAMWDDALCNAPQFRWPGTDRIVVVSPHPDDETLGVGGLVAMAVERCIPVVVLSVTNGEAAYPCDDLASVRRRELAAALAVLGEGGSITQHYLDLPDGGLEGREIELRNIIRHFLFPGDLVLCPLVNDGHSDHVATANASMEAAHQVNAHLRCFPIWAWQHHKVSSSALLQCEKLWLSKVARQRKRKAIACFRSQIGGGHPVVPPWMLEHLDRDFETLVDPSQAQ